MVGTDEVSELERAVQALSALIATGPAPDQVTEAMGALVAGWADEPDMSTDVMLNRVESLWDGFSTEAAALQEQLSDVGDGNPAELNRGHRVLAALNTAVATLAAISSR